MTKGTKRIYALATAILFYRALGLIENKKNITYVAPPGYSIKGTTAKLITVNNGIEIETNTPSLERITFDDSQVLEKQSYLVEHSSIDTSLVEKKPIKRKR